MACVVTEAKWTCDRENCESTGTTNSTLRAPSGWVRTPGGDVCDKCAGVDYLHVVMAQGMTDDEIRRAQDEHRPPTRKAAS